MIPLAPPWRRALALALPTLVVLVGRGRSSDPPERGGDLFSLAGGGVSVLEWLAGLGLVWLALREAVPGLGVGAARSLVALAGGVASSSPSVSWSGSAPGRA